MNKRYKVRNGHLARRAPKVVEDFSVSYLELETLEGCPEEVKYYFDCDRTPIKTMKGCPKKVKNINAYSCKNLEDISDIPSNTQSINVGYCENIKVFTKKIDSILWFTSVTDIVRQRIKEWEFYEVVEETNTTITVRQKSIGEKIIDSI